MRSETLSSTLRSMMSEDIELSNTNKGGRFEGQVPFNDILRLQSLPFYIEYNNPHESVKPEHQKVIYKRLTPIGDLDMWSLFKGIWRSGFDGCNNHYDIDYKLFSTMHDAVRDVNAWSFCDSSYVDPAKYHEQGFSGNTLSHEECHPPCDATFCSAACKFMGMDGQYHAEWYDWADWSFTLKLCCEEDKLKCLACIDGLTEEAWCSQHPDNKHCMEVNDILLSNTKQQGGYEGREAFNKILSQQTLPFYIEYNNPHEEIGQDHQKIIYKRLTSIDDLDMWTIFTEYWLDREKGYKNDFKVDFNLFSNMHDALNNRNAWEYCNVNNLGIGFPAGCGPKGHGDSTYLSFTTFAQGYGWTNWSFTLKLCCEEDKLKCLACKDGLTEEEWCAQHADSENLFAGCLKDESDESEFVWSGWYSVVLIITLLVAMYLAINYLIKKKRSRRTLYYY